MAKHSMMVVDGEIEVCDTCVNSLGYPVAWELTSHERRREPGGRAAIVFVILMIAAAIAVPLFSD